MPFYTTLHFYRPTTPPRMTGESLAQFVAAFENLKVSEGDDSLTVQVRFGKAIDQDDRPSDWQEPVYETISVTREIEWDIEDHCPSLQAVHDALAGHDRPVYRAFIQLGRAAPAICERMARTNSPENEVDLRLNEWSLNIGPVTSFDLGCEVPFHVGWISVDLSGYGYLYPWTFAELARRAEGDLAIRRVTEMCRATWPVKPGSPGWLLKRARRRMRDLWPYAELDKPWDWYWGLEESD